MTSFQWIREDNGHFHRKMTASELYTYAVSADGIPRFNILPIVRIKLDKPESQELVSTRFRKGLQALYYQVPNASFRGVAQPDGCSFDVHYQTSTSSAEANEWLTHALEEKVIPVDQGDIDTILRSESSRMGHRRIDNDVAASFRLCVVYFTKDSMVPEIGIVGSLEHFSFDGTGTYHLFNKLFENIARGASIEDENVKAEPEIPFFAAIPSEVMNADHSDKMAALMDGFTAPHKSDSLKTKRQGRPSDEIAIMSEGRFLFTQKETTALLAKAKILGLTISQLAQAAHLIAIFSEDPAEESKKVNYTGLVNARPYLALPSPFFGNAIAPYFGSIDCQNLSASIRSGRAETASDAQALYRIAQDLTRSVQRQREDTLGGACAVGTFTDAVMKDFDPSKPPTDLPISILADGLIDRYIKHHYEAVGQGAISFQVFDAHLFILDPSPTFQARTSTFDNRLSLSLSFNSLIYKQEKIDLLARRWGDALRLCVEKAKRSEDVGNATCRSRHSSLSLQVACA